jgi:hypothetical protein
MGSKRRRQFERQMIECRAKVLQGVSDEQREWIARRIVGSNRYARVARHFRVGLTLNGLFCLLDEQANLVAQLIEVRSCSLEL